MDELTPLSNAALGQLSDTVRVPGYDRSRLSPGIVHIGLGNFHRAHQAWYLHRLFDAGLDQDWAIVGAGVRSADGLQREKLLKQDCLSTLIALDPSGSSAEVCGSMIDFLPVEEGNGALIRQMADPATRIVSLTVTEGGYYVAPATFGFDGAHPDMQHDAAHPDKPRTAFGAIIAALKARRKSHAGPFTCLSCDNLQGNGSVLKRTILSLARLSDHDLADWIEARCTFPNSMVDCIVPATGPNEIARAATFGIADAAPVTHETFRQWVVEDAFCAGRPALEKVGVTFSDRVHDFEQMKIRILNGGHQIIAPAGELLGLDTIAETMAHPKIRRLLQRVVENEVAPHVAAVSGYTPDDYLSLILQRFSNPEIADTTRRVAFDGSSRQPGFLLPSVRDSLSAGKSVEGLALVSALWARYCAGTREDGSDIAANDPEWRALNEKAQAAASDPSSWLQLAHVYGDLGNDPHFAEPFRDQLKRIYDKGVEAAIEAYLEAA